MKKLVTLNVDTQNYTQKPKSAKIGAIQKRLETAKTTISLEDLAYRIHNGYSIKAAALNGRTAQDWEQQDIFCLDIDNSEDDVEEYGYLTIEEALKRCEAFRIKPIFYYKSFSYKEEHQKYRLVFCIDNTVTSKRLRLAVQLALMTLFPESDKACKNADRLYFASKQGVTVVDYNNTINAVDTIDAATNFMKMNKKNASQAIQRFCADIAINSLKGRPYAKFITTQEKEEIEADNTSEHILIRHTLNNSDFDFEIFDFFMSDDCNTVKTARNCKFKNFVKKKVKVERERNFKFDELEKKCKLYREHTSGVNRAKHDSFMHLCFNLIHVEGGKTRLTDALAHYTDELTEYDYANKINSANNAADKAYEPSACSAFRCPHFNECKNKKGNLLDVVGVKRGKIRRIESEIELISLEEAYDTTEAAIREALNNTDANNMYVIAAPTAIGKSNMLIRVAQEDNNFFNNTIICAPNHELVAQTEEDLKDIIDLVAVKQPLILDEAVKCNYAKKQQIGDYYGAKKALQDYVYHMVNTKTDENREEVYMQVDSIRTYLESVEEARKTDKCILCTHARMLHLNNKNVKRIVVDEDILPTHLQSISIDLSELTKLYNRASSPLKEAIKKAKDFFIAVEESPKKNFDFPRDIIVSKEDIKDFIKAQKTIDFSINLFDLFNIEAACADNGAINAYVKRELPSLPITVLNATADQDIYTNVFRDRIVTFKEIDNVEQAGRVILYPYKSFSRRSITDSYNTILENIKTDAEGVINMITFKSFTDNFKREGFNTICNYGACAGLNAYAGQDLVVVGTPHNTIPAYLLLAHACGVREEINADMSYTAIERNGFEFSFNTFNSNEDADLNKMMQRIQSYKIEADLVQAVGRARALRKDCTVHVFSNYPVKNCDLVNETEVTRTVKEYNKVEEAPKTQKSFDELMQSIFSSFEQTLEEKNSTIDITAELQNREITDNIEECYRILDEIETIEVAEQVEAPKTKKSFDELTTSIFSSFEQKATIDLSKEELQSREIEEDMQECYKILEEIEALEDLEPEVVEQTRTQKSFDELTRSIFPNFEQMKTIDITEEAMLNREIKANIKSCYEILEEIEIEEQMRDAIEEVINTDFYKKTKKLLTVITEDLDRKDKESNRRRTYNNKTMYLHSNFDKLYALNTEYEEHILYYSFAEESYCDRLVV